MLTWFAGLERQWLVALYEACLWIVVPFLSFLNLQTMGAYAITVASKLLKDKIVRNMADQ